MPGRHVLPSDVPPRAACGSRPGTRTVLEGHRRAFFDTRDDFLFPRAAPPQHRPGATMRRRRRRVLLPPLVVRGHPYRIDDGHRSASINTRTDRRVRFISYLTSRDDRSAHRHDRRPPPSANDRPGKKIKRFLRVRCDPRVFRV